MPKCNLFGPSDSTGKYLAVALTDGYLLASTNYGVTWNEAYVYWYEAQFPP
jgi:hypothetical protein